MNRYCTLILALVFLLGSIKDGSSSPSGRLSIGDIEAKVKEVLEQIATSPTVNPAYKLDNVVIDIKAGGTKLDGNIDGAITGIPQTELTKNKFSLIGFKHTVGLHMPKLAATGDYTLNGVVAGLLLLDGRGPFTVELEDVSATVLVLMDAKSRLPALYLKNVTVALSLGKFHVKIDNLFGELSGAFNDMINEIAPEILNNYQPQIEALVADLVFNLLNSILGGGAVGEVDSPAAAGELDLAQLIDRLPEGEIDSSRINAAIGEMVNHLIKTAIDMMPL